MYNDMLDIDVSAQPSGFVGQVQAEESEGPNSEYEELVERYFEAKKNADFYRKEMNGCKAAMIAWLKDAGYDVDKNGIIAKHNGGSLSRSERKGAVEWKKALISTGAVRDVDAYGENFRKPSTVVYTIKETR